MIRTSISTAALALAASLLPGGGAQDSPQPTPARAVLSSAVATEPVSHDADDPAIWVHPTDPSKSLILGTDKLEKDGGVYVFDLDGKVVQSFRGLDRPNNVDVRAGFALAGETVDLAVATERGGRRLLVWAIDRETGRLTDVTGRTTVFADREGEEGAPMGIGLYRRPGDSALYAVVGSKSGPKEGYLHQYRLVANGPSVDAEFVRAFGKFSGKKEIEAIVCDDELGFVYYSDERVGIRKYQADPEAIDAGREVDLFARSGYKGDHEGLAILPDGPGTGWLLGSDQVEDRSRLQAFRREEDNAHVRTILTDADETDGIEVCAQPLGERFPRGILVMMNSKGRNFHIYDLRQVLAALE